MSKQDKQKRRAERLRAEGKCPHCGEPCAPYFECAERRAYKNARRRARRLGAGPVVPATGQGVTANSNESVPAYTSKPGDVRRLPRQRRERYKPTHSIPFEEMDEDQRRLEILGLTSYCPMTEDEVDEILWMKRLIFWRKKVLADPARADEQWFARTVVREALAPCIAVLHERGLNVGQIVAMLRAPWGMVRYYWLQCEAAQRGQALGERTG